MDCSRPDDGSATRLVAADGLEKILRSRSGDAAMLVRDLRTGRLVMLDPTKLSGVPRGYVNGAGQWAGDERLGLPFLAALPALAAKVLPLVSSILPMLTGGGGKSEPAPSPPPAPAPP